VKGTVGNLLKSESMQQYDVENLDIAVVTSLLEKVEHYVLWRGESEQLSERRLFIHLRSTPWGEQGIC